MGEQYLILKNRSIYNSIVNRTHFLLTQTIEKILFIDGLETFQKVKMRSSKLKSDKEKIDNCVRNLERWVDLFFIFILNIEYKKDRTLFLLMIQKVIKICEVIAISFGIFEVTCGSDDSFIRNAF